MPRPDDDLGRVMLEATDGRLLDLHTQLRGNVVSYDEATKTCEIEVATKLAVPDGEGGFVFQAIPNLTHVPVAWPSAGGFMLHWPIEAGDSVFVTFDEQDSQRWEVSGKVSEPGWLERFGLSSGIAHPYSRKVIVTSGAQMVCPSAFVFGDPASAQFAALSNKVDANFATLVTLFNAHTHLSAAPGSPTAVPAPPMVGSSFPATACAKLKAE